MRIQLLLWLMLCVLTLSGSYAIAQVREPSNELVLKYTALRQELLAKDPEAICSELETLIPFKRAGRLILIEAEVDGLRGNFIFDTGAPYLVLNKTYFRNYDMNEALLASGITGGETTVLFTRIENLKMGKVNYMDLGADVIELGHIENARGVKVLGLLGLNLFKNFEIEIDVRSSVIKLRKCDRRGVLEKAGVVGSYDVIVPIDYFDNSIFVKCTVAGKLLRFGIDSGAEVNAISNRVNKRVLETIEITGRSTLMGTGTQSIEILYGNMSSLYLGEWELKGMRTIITQLDDMGNAYGLSIDGMLGYELLARGRVTINIRAKEMKLQLYENFKS